MAYLAAFVAQQGYPVHVLDAEALDYGFEEIMAHVRELEPDVVGFSCTTPLFPSAVVLAEAVKEMFPRAAVVLGGPHISALPRESLEASEAIDFVVFGEGEESFLELIKAWEGSVPFEEVAGVGFKKEGRTLINPPRPFIRDIDALPFPARHLFPLERYRDSIHYQEPYTVMVTSRGCPFRCIFCASSVTWARKVRLRSPENVIAEIAEVVRRYGIRNINFADDTFTLNRERTIDICRRIVQEKFNIKFLCSSRLDTIDAERLHWLKKAGCHTLTFGIETGNQEIAKVIRKDVDLSPAPRVFKMVQDHGIAVHSSYIIGNPGDTRETIEQTIQFALDSGTDEAQFSISTPFPGTELWKMSLEQGLLPAEDFTAYKWYYSVAANLSRVSNEELISYQRRAYDLFQEKSQARHQLPAAANAR
jgi:radical SAM superfamily enzyme YgiQ (UPF0313 family)